MFTIEYSSEKELKTIICEWNIYLKDKGISLVLLRNFGGRGLIYVCRKHHLKRDLSKPGVERLLKTCGYDSIDVDSALETLKTRLQETKSFPHEIGVFLGYPLGDVMGFIQNAGKNSKCTGCWKVYCNECEAIKTFERFKKCKDIYMNLWRNGKSVQQLTVVA
jgi:hypothetical protein